MSSHKKPKRCIKFLIVCKILTKMIEIISKYPKNANYELYSENNFKVSPSPLLNPTKKQIIMIKQFSSKILPTKPSSLPQHLPTKENQLTSTISIAKFFFSPSKSNLCNKPHNFHSRELFIHHQSTFH